MYQFSGKIKLFSIILVVIGALGIGWGFKTAPKTLEEAKEIMAKQAAHGSHDSGHGDVHHNGHTKKETQHETHGEKHKSDTIHEDSSHKHTNHNSTDHKDHSSHDTVLEKESPDQKDVHKKEEGRATAHGNHHAEHVFHQLQNRPWASFYVALMFFLGITLLVLAFYAAQRVAQSGWSVVLFRVMEAISANLIPTSIIMAVVIVLTGMHFNHLFTWMGEGVMDKTSDNFDPIVYGKRLWLNTPRWTIMSIVYLAGWNLYRWWIRKNSILEDQGIERVFKRNYNVSVIFLVFFMITESMATWDWIMGIDPHWFSTLFGWYVLASLLVCALTVIAFVTIYLRSLGYLPKVNDSHIHDLAKFMFGFSVFWTYLWFAQFMLIWYADIPEETTYFVLRFKEYKILLLSMVVMNFVFPVLLLLNSDFKSRSWFVLIGGTVILIGHYLDLFIMIMPGTVGGSWSFGIPELGAPLFFIGIFIYSVLSSFAKADPVTKGNPFLKESEHYHYYNIEHHSGSGEDYH